MFDDQTKETSAPLSTSGGIPQNLPTDDLFHATEKSYQESPVLSTSSSSPHSSVSNNAPIEDIFSQVDRSVDRSVGPIGSTHTVQNEFAEKKKAPIPGLTVKSGADPRLSPFSNPLQPPAAKKKYFIIGLLVLVVIGGGVVAYMFVFQPRTRSVEFNDATLEGQSNIISEQEVSNNSDGKTKSITPQESSSDSQQPNDSSVTTPLPIDSDNDGLSDEEEHTLGTDPQLNDSDSDGLLDRDEIAIYRTDPRNPDTDNDTYLDGEEVRNGYNPRGPGTL